MPIAYSYIRFSSEKQSKGDSVNRQETLSRQYIENNPELELELDTQLNMRDLGVSAFKSKNLTEGALGKFTALVYQGAIEQGSYLLIENLDRFSRNDAWIAVNDLTALIRAGIIVVTLSDENVYSEETMSGNDGTLRLLQSVLVFTRANEESKIKSERISKAWIAKFNKIDQGIQLTKRVPFWINPEDRRKFLKDKVKIVKRIFKLNAQGMGTTRIAVLFNTEGVTPPTSRAKDWNVSTVKKVLNSKAVLGTLVAGNGKDYFDYYPRVIDDETWSATRTLNISSNAVRDKDSRVVHPLAGLCFCESCGLPARRAGKTGRIRQDGTRAMFKTLVCSGATKGVNCAYRSINYSHIQQAVNRALDITALVGVPDKVAELNLELEFAFDEVRDLLEANEGALRRNKHNQIAKQERADLLERLEALRRRSEEVGRMRRGVTIKQVDRVRKAIFEGSNKNADYRQVLNRIDINFLEHWLEIKLHDGSHARMEIADKHGKFSSEYDQPL